MNIIALIGIGLVVLAVFLARTVIRAEYGWWGPPLAERIVHVAAVIAARPGQREEWLDQLALCQERGIPGVLFSRQLAKGSVKMRAGHIHTKRRRAGFWKEGVYLYNALLQFACATSMAVAGTRNLAQRDYALGFFSVGLFAIFAPLLIWCTRMALRTIDVKWIESCLNAGLTREQLDTSLWTHGERAALAAYEVAQNEHFNNGTPWPWAQRSLVMYRMGWLFTEWFFKSSAGHAEKRAARDLEQSAT